MNYILVGIFGGGAVLMFQTDWGGILTPAFAVLAAVVTVVGQLRTKKLENELQAQNIQQIATEKVIAAWETLFKQRTGEITDIRKRLGQAEMHTRICDKTLMKLVMQLIKNGIEVDLDLIMKEVQVAEQLIIQSELHATLHPEKEKESKPDGHNP